MGEVFAGRYELIDLIGEGGMGTIWVALDRKTDGLVAAKVLRQSDAGTLLRFVREQSVRIHDPNVLTPLGWAGEDDRVLFTMPIIRGGSVATLVGDHGPLPPHLVAELLRQTLSGLAAVHAADIVHRDIKPANILLENGVQRVKITDFGLARTVDDASVTQSGVIAGTPMYMSPEQAEGHPVDHRSDLFSLGTVLYAMCTGRPPFRAPGTFGVLRRVVEETPRPIRDINPEIPQWLCDVVEKLHAKTPERRFQSAREVADLLGGYLAELQMRGDVTPLTFTADTSSPTRVERSHGSVLARLRRRPSRRRWLIAAGALVVVLGALAALVIARWWPRTAPFATLTVDCDDPELAVELLFRPDAAAVEPVGAIPGDGPERGGPAAPAKAAAGRTYTFRPAPGLYEVRGSKGGKVQRRDFVNLAADDERRLVWRKADGWEQLFNGADLAGWKTPQADVKAWRVENGMLVGTKACQYLFSVGEFEDFHLRAEMRINGRGDSGIYFRSPYGIFGFRNGAGQPLVGIDGYEAQVIGNFCADHTGDLAWRPHLRHWSVLEASSLPPPRDNTWLLLEVIATGNRLEIKVDGRTTVEHVDVTNTFRRGHIVLESFRPETVVHFRKIEIRPLTNNVPE